jgi:hypothetical protein
MNPKSSASSHNPNCLQACLQANGVSLMIETNSIFFPSK